MFEDLKKNILENDFTDVLGQNEIKSELKSALLMERHVILVGPPGCGKTTLAKSVTGLLSELVVNNCPYKCNPDSPSCPDCLSKKEVKKIKIKGAERFLRIQGSPDLSAEDLIGDIDPIKAMKFGPLDIQSFTPGKIFKANGKILFFDELNRCSEKLQNALLQVLEEKKATISSYDVELKSDFIFIGTMNPGDTSTEPLSDVFLDRFDLIYMDYPKEIATEKEIIIKKGKEAVEFSDSLLSLMVKFIHELRVNKDLEKKPSVRASIGLYERAQGNAILDKRNKVNFRDIEKAIYSVLGHRISLKPSVRYTQTTQDLLKKELKKFMSENRISDSGDIP
ncbi:MAG: AAA family ATPase [archaeon]